MLFINQNNQNRMNSKCLWLTFRKIVSQSSELEGKRVSLEIQTADSTFELQCSRIIKNGIANLYGESISLPLSVDSFTIFISDHSEQNEETLICSFDVTIKQISCITQSKNIFKTENQILEIFWEGCILDEEAEDFLQPSQDVNRDFSEIQMPNAQSKICPKTNMVYQRKNSHQDIKKRSQFRVRKQKTISEFIQDRLMCQNTSTQEDSLFQKTQLKETFDSLHQIMEKSSQGDRSCSSIKQYLQQSHPIFVSKPKKERTLKRSETGGNRIQRNRNNFIHKKLNYQTIICTSIVGLISGLTAVQF